MPQPGSTQLYHAGSHVATPGLNPQQPDIILRRYRILGTCGAGGFGTVLACWDTRLQRRVAIKRMPLTSAGSPVANASTIDEALGEARTSSLLEQPNIVTVHDFEVEAGIAYLVMEYVDGLTLQDLMARVEGGTLTHDECAYLTQEVGRALAFAHANGVLHLDIKPTNIMFDRNGRVKLCDFGMATLASATGYGGARGGTVGYMPPEQITGGMVDERTDTFALAVVILQALTGTSPFAANTAEESLDKINRGMKHKPSKLDPTLAGVAEETLLYALDSDPAARPADVSVMAGDLCFGLGDPEAGAASIASLMAQTAGEQEADPTAWEGERLTLGYRLPWLEGAIIRGSAAAAVFVSAFHLVGYALPQASLPAIPAALALAAVAALWPPAGSLLVMVALFLALTNAGVTTATVLLAGAIGVAGGLWWALAFREHSSTAGLLAAPALQQSAASSAIAAATLSPAMAGYTAGLSWLLTKIYVAGIQTGFVSGPLVDQVKALLTPGQALAGVGVIVAATIGAAITGDGSSTGRTVGAQVACCIAVIASQLVGARLENGGIWASPGWSTTGVAVLLCVFVCLAEVALGPREPDQEEE